MAEFTEIFDIEEGMWEGYRRFIERLRNAVAGGRYSHNHPVTPNEVNPPARFFDIQFHTNDHNIRIRFRRDNLYLVGFQMENSNQWLELSYDDNNPVHRIPGSTFLTIGDMYDDLTAAAGVPALTSILVGRQQLINAVNNLATSDHRPTRATSIIVVLVMIIESLRFNQITDHFTTHRTTEPTPSWIEDFLHGWRTLSNSLLHVDADADFRFPFNNRFQVSTAEAALAVIGILKGRFFGPGPRPRRMADDGEEEYCEGRPLVEVFSVTINNIDGDSDTSGDIYGTIQVGDGLSVSQFIYNRGTNDSDSIHTRGDILFNGPARCITADDDFIFKVALKSKEWLSEDDELSRGEISWDVMNITANKYDQLIRRQVDGEGGASATVNYAVLSDAVQARLVVTLIDSDGGEAIDIYGQIEAQNSRIGEKSVVFRKKDNKYINVKPGGVIPLSRSVVAVPTNSTLIVSAELTRSIFGPDDKIASGQATFSARLSGTYEQYISSVHPTNYRIKVTVTWDWYVY